MARAQEAVQTFNQDTRYGRAELALERVAASARETFSTHHRDWGDRVRVAEVEVVGIRSAGGPDVDAIVRVLWYRSDDQELRTTLLKQNWRDDNGWLLVAEQRLDGDIGLLGEAVVRLVPEGKHEPAQFPTVRLEDSP
jgi:hypothetical protein